MKRIITILALTAALFAINNQAKAQATAHINVDELLAIMPETEAASKEMEKYTYQLQKDLDYLQTEAKTKYENIVANQNNWTQLRLTKEQEELEDMTQRLQQESDQAQQKVSKKQIELMQPIIDKAQNAINDVAREKGYTYVLDSSSSKGVVIFLEKGEDMLPLVKAKLAIP